jgi:uncharacterized protein (TIGR00290 family)
LAAPASSEGRSVKRIVLSWSSGKDSAWALHTLRQSADVEVVGLLTTINEHFQRVAMHGTRVELLRMQAASAGLPLIEVLLPWPCANEQYERVMAACCEALRREAVEAVAFGDLFLEDVRAYREQQMAKANLEPLFPLWGMPTRALAATMIASGLKAKIATLDPERVPRHFAGAEFDAGFLAQLPADADPCAERGEFHTFCYAGPMFRELITVTVGEVVERDGFVYADLCCAPINAAYSPTSPK